MEKSEHARGRKRHRLTPKLLPKLKSLFNPNELSAAEKAEVAKPASQPMKPFAMNGRKLLL